MNLAMLRTVAGRFLPEGLACPSRARDLDARGMLCLAVAVFCITAPLELSQVAFALIGALGYAMMQALQPRQRRKAVPGTIAGAGAKAAKVGCTAQDASACRLAAARCSSRPARTPQAMQAAPPAPFCKKPSACPVSAPAFAASGFEAEVAELLGRISPSNESDKVVQQLADKVRHILQQTIPEVEVVGFASGDLVRGTAFGVAVPEVDIVVSVSPHVLAQRIQGRVPQRGAALQLDARKLQKSAIRACTDRLVSSGSFKFRRSAFRGQEPKVTLLAPASLGIYDEAVPIDFSVNSSMPLYNAALLTECGQIEPRARELITLVKRWAKDRGVCHAARGHLSPYAWTLLAIYYLQVGVPEEGALLPPLSGFKLSAGLAQAPAAGGAAPTVPSTTGSPGCPLPSQAAGRRLSPAALFRGFIRFYAMDFDWRKEAISVRAGCRGPPGLALPLHIVLHDDGATTEVGPAIESPFDAGQNLGEGTTATSLARLHEELQRAETLCAAGASLAELVQPWAPPERESGESTADAGDTVSPSQST